MNQRAFECSLLLVTQKKSPLWPFLDAIYSAFVEPSKAKAQNSDMSWIRHAKQQTQEANKVEAQNPCLPTGECRDGDDHHAESL